MLLQNHFYLYYCSYFFEYHVKKNGVGAGKLFVKLAHINILYFNYDFENNFSF